MKSFLAAIGALSAVLMVFALDDFNRRDRNRPLSPEMELWLVMVVFTVGLGAIWLGFLALGYITELAIWSWVIGVGVAGWLALLGRAIVLRRVGKKAKKSE